MFKIQFSDQKILKSHTCKARNWNILYYHVLKVFQFMQFYTFFKKILIKCISYEEVSSK